MKSNYFKVLLTIMLLSFSFSFAQTNRGDFWSTISKSSVSEDRSAVQISFPENAKVYQLDDNQLTTFLSNVPKRGTTAARNSAVIVRFPNSNGVMQSFRVFEASVMEPALQAQFPNIRSFAGQGIDDKTATIRFSLSPQEGLSGTIRSGINPTTFIEKYNAASNVYAVYDRTHSVRETGWECQTDDSLVNSINETITGRDANDGIFHTFRLALSCNGEYGTWAGGTLAGVMAKFNATMTRVNGVFESDFATTLVMINDLSSVVFFDPATDPYSSMGNWNGELQSTLTSNIGEANYDIGHMFGRSGGGGNAGCIGCICEDGSKGSGITSPGSGDPEGDTFDIDYVAHEMGHQLGANHTFSHSNEGTGANLEPGSGSTIMGYAGITGATDVQPHSDAYFHFFSIEQVTANILTKTCDTETNLNQTTPTANAGLDYTIPAGTAFQLKGLGTSDGTTTYCWEQNDEGAPGNTFPSSTDTSGPSFRSLTPTTSPNRYLPKFATVLAGGLPGTQWEMINTVSRTYGFKLTVRDNIAGGGQNKIDDMTVTVDDTAGPFTVTSQTAATSWDGGTTQTITWDVANTDSGTVNEANVNILLTTDDGATFTTLLANTPNDGSEAIIVPNTTTTNGRIVVEAVNNIFYAVNAAPISIQASEFAMTPTATAVAVCAPADAVFTFTYHTFLGFSDTTTFTASGLPAGTTATFSPTTATTDGTVVTVTLSGITDSNVGANTFTATGTAGAIVKSIDLTANIYKGTFDVLTLTSPADASTGVMSPYTLVWNNDPNAASYLVEIASDAAFTTIVDNSTVTTATYNPIGLAVNTDYWWRVTPSNNCATGATSAVWTFKTANIVCGNVYNAADVPVAISTGSGATYTSTLTVAGGDFNITDVNVSLDISHSWDSDLTISLTSPAGTTVVLSDGNGNGDDNYTNTVFDDAAATAITAGSAPFTGSFQPEGSLASFNGETLLGDWILTVVDGASGDGGAINSWSIDICGSPIPGFAFSVADNAMEVCEPDDAVYNFTYNTYAGFNEVTTFTATGAPAGTTVTFSPATATADGTVVTMTVSGLTNANVGNFTIVATGTAAGGMTKTQDLTLKVNSPTFAALTLVSPTDGLQGALPPYTLSWNADANADNYLVEVATDAAFGTIIDTATVTTTTYDPTGIVDDTTYYWRVSPINACATGAASTVWSFTTNTIECGTRSVSYNAGEMPVGPDAGTVTTSTLELFDAVITDVNVTINVEHSWMSDLDIFLISPSGTRVELTTDNGGSSDGYIDTTFDDEAATAITTGAYPFTDSYQPEGMLSDFNGENSTGTWTLEITDDLGGDGGNLLSWSLNVCGVRAPAFEMNFTDTSIAVCDDASVDYTFDYETFGGFNEEVTFSATGLPAGTSASFSPATATATGTTVTMTLSGLSTDNIGTHTITATGTAAGGMVFNQDLHLKWNSTTFNDIVLIGPPNGAVNVLGTVDFSWEADASGNADNYIFELSDTADFSNIVDTVTLPAATTNYTSTAVAMNSHYYWRVLPSNGCATATTSGTVFEFDTNDPTCGSFDADSATLPISVGPNAGTTTTSTIDITGAPYDDPAMGVIDVNVTVNIDHSYHGDLDIILTSPAGTSVELVHHNVFGFGANYTNTTFDDQAVTPITSGSVPFTGTFIPENSLSAINAESALGTWTLTIVDNYAGDGGQLNSWSLDICVAVPDQDFDGIVDTEDNCVTTYNPDQIDRDEDGIGDVCDDFIDLLIVVPEGFTPNGDGTNDTWVIAHLNQFPDNQTTVYNRWGNEVFSKHGYNNDWDGTGKNGNLLPAGSYYYVIDTFDPDGGHKEGWVYINY